MYSAASSGLANMQHPVVEDDHTPVVGRHDLLEVVVAEVVPAERLGDLLVVEVDLVDAVDADHRRQLADRDVVLAAHHVGDHVADLVVHQRHAGPVGRRAVRLRTAVMPCTSFGVSRPMSASRSSKRACERSKESSKRTTFSDGCDQIGCRLRAAVDGLRRRTRPASPASSPCSRRRAPRRRRASGTARARPRCSRAASDSPAPMIVGVTKSPCGAAACMTKPERNSSPTSGSNTTVVAKNASAQSRMPVSVSTSSRVGCQIGSLLPGLLVDRSRRSPRSPRRARGCRGSGPARSAACAPRRPHIALLIMFVGASRWAGV